MQLDEDKVDDDGDDDEDEHERHRAGEPNYRDHQDESDAIAHLVSMSPS
jgi:hypothetical protein